MKKKRSVVKRRTAKKRTTKDSKRKTKKPFGGYAISFKKKAANTRKAHYADCGRGLIE